LKRKDRNEKEDKRAEEQRTWISPDCIRCVKDGSGRCEDGSFHQNEFFRPAAQAAHRIKDKLIPEESTLQMDRGG